MRSLVRSRLLLLGVSLIAPVLLAVASAGSGDGTSVTAGVLVGAGLGVAGALILVLALLALVAERSLTERGGTRWAFGAHLAALLLALPGLVLPLATGIGGGTWAERALLAVPVFSTLYYGWLLPGLVVGLVAVTGRRAAARLSREARAAVAGTTPQPPALSPGPVPSEWPQRGRDGVVLGYALLVLGVTTTTQGVLGSAVGLTVSLVSVAVLVVLTRLLLTTPRAT